MECDGFIEVVVCRFVGWQQFGLFVLVIVCVCEDIGCFSVFVLVVMLLGFYQGGVVMKCDGVVEFIVCCFVGWQQLGLFGLVIFCMCKNIGGVGVFVFVVIEIGFYQGCVVIECDGVVEIVVILIKFICLI